MDASRTAPQQLATEYRARGLTQDAFDNRFTRLAVLSARQKAGELDESMHVLYDEFPG